MAKKEIIWSKNALNELQDTLDFYNERNGNTKYSSKLLEEIENLLELLSINEMLGRKTTDKNSRVLVKKVYLIFYEIKKDKLEILSFWDNRQNPDYRL
jgi:toxin YoeB